MKIKVISTGFIALLICISCNNDSILTNSWSEDASTIQFAINNEVETKGSIIEESNAIENFGVIAYSNNNQTFSPDFMDNVMVSKTADNEWSYSPIKYWTTSNILSFYAYSPYADVSENGVDITYSEQGVILTFTTPTDVEEQPDLMVAVPQRELNNTQSPIKLEMKHALTAIGFTISGDGEQITKIGFKNIYTSGEIEITADSPTWQLLSTSSSNYWAGLPSSGIVADKSGELVINDNGYLMMLPQQLPNDAQLVVEIDGEEKTLDIGGTNWVMGEKKIYDISINSPWMLADFTATDYPESDYWLVADTYETAKSYSQYKGFCDAINTISETTDREITVEFTNLSALAAYIMYYNTSSDLSALKKISLPMATTIYGYAFYACDGLEVIEMPLVTNIGLEAFRNCDKLTDVYAPVVEEVQGYAFADCDGLLSIDLPVATTIGAYAFESCSNLKSINFPLATTIKTGAFEDCKSLTDVSLPSATDIGSYAFSDCDSLITISLPAAITIQSYAFDSCGLLGTVDLPLATSVGIEAFSYCISLSNIYLPKAKTIDAQAFEYCKALTAIDFPLAEDIGREAFRGCTELSIVRLASAKSIGNYAFRSCSNLLEMELSTASGAKLEDIGLYVFYFADPGDVTLTIGNTSSSISISGNTLISGSSSYTFKEIIQL